MNYYLKYKAQILAIAKRTDIKGCGGKKPTLGVACDVFDQNAKTVVEGHGDFVECGVPKSNKEFWKKARQERLAIGSLKEAVALQHQFANKFNK